MNVADATTIIRGGGVIAYPTEAVFGIGCDPTNLSALRRILAMKGRAEHKGLILVAAHTAQLEPWLAPLQPAWREQMQRAWPGPVTFVVPAANDNDTEAATIVRGGRDTIAVRVSAHPVVRALCESCGHALVSTSANTSGAAALIDAESVARDPALGAALDAIVDGETGPRRVPSDIIDIRTGEKLR